MAPRWRPLPVSCSGFRRNRPARPGSSHPAHGPVRPSRRCAVETPRIQCWQGPSEPCQAGGQAKETQLAHEAPLPGLAEAALGNLVAGEKTCQHRDSQRVVAREAETGTRFQYKKRRRPLTRMAACESDFSILRL
jgi:hypothetical protein